MAQNPMMGAPIQPAAPSSPQGLNFQSDPSNRASFKGFMTSLNALPNISAPPPAPMPAPMVPAADVDIFQPMPMQMGGMVPMSANIGGMPHMLSYITPGEAGVLNAMGGAGAPGPGGVPAFFYDEVGAVSGTTGNFGSGGQNQDFGSDDDNRFDSGSSDDNTTYGLNRPGGGVTIRGNTITGGTITGTDDAALAGFGPPPTAQDDIVGPYIVPSVNLSRTAGRASTPVLSEAASVAATDPFSNPNSAANMQSGMSDAEMESQVDNLLRPSDAPVFSQGNVAAVSLPKPRPDRGSLAAGDSVYDYDIDLLGLGVDPAFEMRSLQEQARGQDFTDRLGSAVVTEDMAPTRVTAPSQPMPADDLMVRPDRGDALAREITARGGIVDVNPVTGQVIGNFTDTPSQSLMTNFPAPPLGDIPEVDPLGISTGPSLPKPRPGTLIDYDDPTQVPSRTVDIATPMPRPSGDMMAQQEASRQAAFGDIPRSSRDMSMASPYDMVSPQAQGLGSFTTAGNAPITDFERNAGLDTMERMANYRTTVTGKGTQPGGVAPPLNDPNAVTMSALDQLARRAGGSSGFAQTPFGVVNNFGSKMASYMFDDIANKGYIPQFDARGQIVATINPKTGQYGRGSVRARVDMNNTQNETERAFLRGRGVTPLDEVFASSEEDNRVLPSQASDIQEAIQETDEGMSGLGGMDGGSSTTQTAPTVTGGSSTAPAEGGRSLRFGYGEMQAPPALDAAMDNFFRMLGGTKNMASGGYVDTSSLAGLAEASGYDTSAGQSISDAMADRNEPDDGPPMDSSNVQTVMATPVNNTPAPPPPSDPAPTLAVNQPTEQTSALESLRNSIDSNVLSNMGMQIGDFVSGLVAPSAESQAIAASMSSLSPQSNNLLNSNMPVGGQLTSVPVPANVADYKSSIAGVEQGIQGLSQVGRERPSSGFSMPKIDLGAIADRIMGQKPSYDNISRMNR